MMSRLHLSTVSSFTHPHPNLNVEYSIVIKLQIFIFKATMEINVVKA